MEKFISKEYYDDINQYNTVLNKTFICKLKGKFHNRFLEKPANLIPSYCENSKLIYFNTWSFLKKFSNSYLVFNTNRVNFSIIHDSCSQKSYALKFSKLKLVLSVFEHENFSLVDYKAKIFTFIQYLPFSFQKRFYWFQRKKLKSNNSIRQIRLYESTN